MKCMIAKYKCVLVACPGNAMTAGPEAIHQLVADLNRIGQPASVVYFPFNQQFETPKPYISYRAPVTSYRDEVNDLFIFPEIVTTFALKIKNAKAAIWWMSVNNFTCNRYGNPLRDRFRYFKNLMRGLRPWKGMKALQHLQHFAQSYYALEFLSAHNIFARLLSDPIPGYTTKNYINNLQDLLHTSPRQNIILYNPKKGQKVIALLKNAYPQWQFFGLEGFNREQLAKNFLKSKIYIDFGHHPGKDRLPREAGIHGCCVITGLLGSALNNIDVNIPPEFKLDQNSNSFVANFGCIVGNIFENFEICSARFSEYRDSIKKEQDIFDRQIVVIFNV